MADHTEETVLATLSALCEEVARGEYGRVEELFGLTSSGDDALPGAFGRLAEAFGMMVVQVEAREFRLTGLIDDLKETQRQLESARAKLAEENKSLKQKVVEMTIEIDQQRKAEQVSEITETDYFQDLQQRAAALRKRSRD